MREWSFGLARAVLIVTASFMSMMSYAGQAAAGDCRATQPTAQLTPSELKDLLARHAQWLDRHNLRTGSWSNRKAAELSAILTDPDRAVMPRKSLDRADLADQIWIGTNFSEAYLNEADLTRADLSKTLMDKSCLHKAQLRGARFVDANMSNSDLSEAQAAGATFDKATLDRANFRDADLSKSSFDGTTLSRADFRNANLQSAVLVDADLNLALFDQANLAGLVFEPKSEMLPVISSIARADHLEELTFINTAAGLIELRQEFRKGELVDEARRVTYAIRKSLRQQKWRGDIQERIDSAFQLIFFELTTDYGLALGRPLMILVCGILVFSVPYLIAILSAQPNRTSDGIWKTWPKDRVRQDLGQNGNELLSLQDGRAISYAIYFSILSAFHLGWRDLNVGTWLSRIQPTEYALVATGWVRTIAGIQAILSVYLLALWVLCYFGQPFG